MTSPRDPHACPSEAAVRREFPQYAAPESETERRVRWRTTATQAYTQLFQLYQELRESGHAYAWATAQEASATAGDLVDDLGELLNERHRVPPTQQPTPPATPCRSTQHCAAWGWCHRCDPTAATAGTHMVKAVDALHVPAYAAGTVYGAAMDVLRRAAQPLPLNQQRARCSLAVMGQPGHYPHPWEPQPGMTGVVCPGSGIDQHTDDDGQEEPCPAE